MSTKTKKITCGIIGFSLVLTVAILNQGQSINVDIKGVKYNKKSITKLIAADVLTASVDPQPDYTTFTPEPEVIVKPVVIIEPKVIAKPAVITGSVLPPQAPVPPPQAPAVIKPTIKKSVKTTIPKASSVENPDNNIEMPASLKEIKPEKIYENQTYKNKVLELIVTDTENCSGDNSMGCLKNAYGLKELEEKDAKQFTDKEIGDVVVFSKKPGEIIKTPKIVNLQGKVGSNPAILATSKPNDNLTVKVLANVKGGTVPVMTIEGTTDAEGKGVFTLPKKLLPGDYTAKISAKRKTASIGMASVLDSSSAEVTVDGKDSLFTVETNVDTDFYISDFEITKESVHEPYQGETKEIVSLLLATLNKMDSGFDSQKYIEFARTGGSIFIAKGKVSQNNTTENSVVYLAYKSVVFGSAVIADASQEGVFQAKVPKELEKTIHNLTAYAYNPKQAVSSSLKSLQFKITE